MLDDGELTAEEIAGVVGVARSTLYENLSAYKDGGPCVLVVYRNTRPGKVDPDTNLKFIHRAFRGHGGSDDVDKHPEPDMTAHIPYLDAVADALKAAGLNAGRAEDTSDEWRSGFISIATRPDGDPGDDSETTFVLCWDWRHGWLSCWDSQDGTKWIRYYTGPVAASPAKIAVAAGARLAGNSEDWSMDQPGWNHDPDDDGYEEDFAADLERDLAEFADRQPGGEG